jgi:hypothetical protein
MPRCGEAAAAMLVEHGRDAALINLVEKQRDGRDDADAALQCAAAGLFLPLICELGALLLRVMRLGASNILFIDNHKSFQPKEEVVGRRRAE